MGLIYTTSVGCGALRSKVQGQTYSWRQHRWLFSRCTVPHALVLTAASIFFVCVETRFCLSWLPNEQLGFLFYLKLEVFSASQKYMRHYILPHWYCDSPVLVDWHHLPCHLCILELDRLDHAYVFSNMKLNVMSAASFSTSAAFIHECKRRVTSSTQVTKKSSNLTVTRHVVLHRMMRASHLDTISSVTREHCFASLCQSTACLRTTKEMYITHKKSCRMISTHTHAPGAVVLLSRTLAWTLLQSATCGNTRWPVWRLTGSTNVTAK